MDLEGVCDPVGLQPATAAGLVVAAVVIVSGMVTLRSVRDLNLLPPRAVGRRYPSLHRWLKRLPLVVCLHSYSRTRRIPNWLHDSGEKAEGV